MFVNGGRSWLLLSARALERIRTAGPIGYPAAAGGREKERETIWLTHSDQVLAGAKERQPARSKRFYYLGA